MKMHAPRYHASLHYVTAGKHCVLVLVPRAGGAEEQRSRGGAGSTLGR